MERKLAAILVADVVGYSRLMGEDETGTLERLKSLRKEVVQPRIKERKGRIVKLMGDGLLAEFPSVVEAVQCAVDVQRSMIGREADLPDERRIKLRIGVNLGDIIVEGSDIYGDGVNVAARLEGLADPGGICISGPAFDTVEGKLDLVFEDGGEQQLKNIDRPVRAWRWLHDAKTPHTDSESKAIPPLHIDKPSIAILAFTNMSGDAEQEYFSDGIAEDIITDLARFSWLKVIARNSSFSFKGQNIDLRQVADELGVRYVMEGSVRKAGNRVRITAQLIDAQDGSHIWAERYNRQLEDIFDLQDEMTESITAAIAPELEKSELRRTQYKRPDNLDAWDLVLRAKSIAALMNKERIAEARRLAEQALQLQPAYGDALAVIALCYGRDAFLSWSSDRNDNAKSAIRMASEALRENPTDTTALTARSMGEMTLGLYDEAVETMRQCVRVNSNDHTGHRGLASSLARRGDYVEAIREAEVAMTLSPRDPNLFVTYFDLAYAHLANRNAVEAKKWTVKLSQEFPHHIGARQVAAAVFVDLGEIELAKRAMANYLESEPGATISAMRERFTFGDPDFRERYLSALRRAGMPKE